MNLTPGRIRWDGSNSTEVADFLNFKNRDNLDTAVKFTVGFNGDGTMKVADVGDSIIRHGDGVYSVDHAAR
jgi:hypothetical protein